MAFTRLSIQNAESIAPDSENSMIAESVIIKLKTKYKKVIVLFDNDEAGIKSMLKYKERYDLDYINLDFEKDLSDTVKKYGVDFTRDVLLKLIKKLI
jgi:DNA primase